GTRVSRDRDDEREEKQCAAHVFGVPCSGPGEGTGRFALELASGADSPGSDRQRAGSSVSLAALIRIVMAWSSAMSHRTMTVFGRFADRQWPDRAPFAQAFPDAGRRRWVASLGWLLGVGSARDDMRERGSGAAGQARTPPPSARADANDNPAITR